MYHYHLLTGSFAYFKSIILAEENCKRSNFHESNMIQTYFPPSIKCLWSHIYIFPFSIIKLWLRPLTDCKAF